MAQSTNHEQYQSRGTAYRTAARQFQPAFNLFKLDHWMNKLSTWISATIFGGRLFWIYTYQAAETRIMDALTYSQDLDIELSQISNGNRYRHISDLRARPGPIEQQNILATWEVLDARPTHSSDNLKQYHDLRIEGKTSFNKAALSA
ncbi:hypothetical protein BYT27DRAFT_7337522 [Phlegmacium glaucopus]|nr:hypothetical protein BYT27DRAFT_7337522 [Phlegmacium glaucopus]